MRIGRRGWTRAAAVAATGALVLAVPLGTALAEPPFRVPSQITDRSGVLTGSDVADIQSAINELSSEDQTNLFVVYVDDFTDPAESQDWAEQTRTESDLGTNDILLAIATQGRAYAVRVADSSPLTDSQLNAIAENDIRPELADDDWAGAAIAAANGYRDAIGGSSSTWWWVAGGVVVIGGGGYLLYRRSRRKAQDGAGRGGPGGGGQGEPGGPAAPRTEEETLSTEELSARSVQILIDTDNAVRSSEFELNQAEADFGAAAVAHFRTAFDEARESLTAAFEIRQRIDDDQPEDEPTQRAMMTEIISRCRQAAERLDDEGDRFDELRDLRSRLPQVLAGLPAAIAAQTARIPAAQTVLAGLRQQYSPGAVQSIVDNVDQARERLTFAQTSLDQANRETGVSAQAGPGQVAPGSPGATGTAPIEIAAIAEAVSGGGAAATPPLPTGAAPVQPPVQVPVQPPEAVLAAGAAEEAVGQATTLLDAIERTQSDLAAAAAHLGAAVGAVEQEMGAARSALQSADPGGSGAELAARLDQIQAVLNVARSPQGASDPLTALSKLEEADLALDDILADTRGAQQQQQRAAGQFQQAFSVARAEVASAEDFVTTRRGAIGSEARTRLAEAQRHLAAAEAAAGANDASTGLAEAQHAVALARQASQLAQQDVSGWGGPGGGQQSGGGLGGAILGGILLNAVLNSGRRGGGGGGWGGGFGGGGFGGGGGGFGGSFGGGGRSGGGGRF